MDLTLIADSFRKIGVDALGGLLTAGATAAGGPLAGGIAGAVVSALKEALSLPEAATPAEVAREIEAQPAAAQAAAEAIDRDMRAIWQIEAQRVSDAQAAEIERGFTAWQTMRTMIQLVVWMGWTVILIVALFGGNLMAKPTMPVTEIVTAWGSVTWVWLLVFHGGHTIKEVASSGLAAFGRAR